MPAARALRLQARDVGKHPVEPLDQVARIAAMLLLQVDAQKRGFRRIEREVAFHENPACRKTVAAV